MIQQFTVMRITPTPNAKTPGHIVKIQSKETKTATTELGTKTSTTQLTFLMKVSQPSVAVGQKVDLDPDKYVVVERPYILPALDDAGNPNPDAGKEVPMKWLQL